MSGETCIDSKRTKTNGTDNQSPNLFEKMMAAIVEHKSSRPSAPLRFRSMPAFNRSTADSTNQKSHSNSTSPESPGFYNPTRWCAALGKPSSPAIGEHIELDWINKHLFPGHRFQLTEPESIAYCDYCARHIWGLGPNACYVCKYCNMTCHLSCCDQVQVQCVYPAELKDDICVGNCDHLDLDESHYSLDDSNSSQNNNSAMLSADHSSEEPPRSSSPYQSVEAVVLRPRVSSTSSTLSTCSNMSNFSTASARRRYSLLRGGRLIDSDESDFVIVGSRSRSSSMRLSNYDFTSLDKQSIQEFDISVNEQEPVTPVLKVTSDRNTTGYGNIDWNKINNERLAGLVSIFNKNDQGLYLKVNNNQSTSCHGTLRVHINLIRPIKMSLTDRPPSIFDIIDTKDKSPDPDMDDFDHLPEVVSMKSFRLPRGSTKLLHIDSSTSAQQVISALLQKFHINDSPHKFALYEHTIQGDTEVSVRKIDDDEYPLRLLLGWTVNGIDAFNELLEVKRIVLQENETSDIHWNDFSLPELRTFLMILNREEEDYRSQIQLKFNLRRNEIKRLLDQSAASRSVAQPITAQ